MGDFVSIRAVRLVGIAGSGVRGFGLVLWLLSFLMLVGVWRRLVWLLGCFLFSMAVAHNYFSHVSIGRRLVWPLGSFFSLSAWPP
jgi:hypothetical protein